MEVRGPLTPPDAGGLEGAPGVRPPRVRLTALATLLLVCAGVYAQAVQAPFFWDDRALVLGSRLVSEGRALDALTSDLWATTGILSGYHRPAVLWSFQLDHALFGAAPMGWHLHSLLWHLAAVGAAFALAAGRLGASGGLAVAAVVGLHPAQSEAVLWIAARNDLMVAAACFGAIALLDAGGVAGGGSPPPQDAQPPRRVAAALLAGLAALSKETGYLLPAAYVAWRLAWGARIRGWDLVSLAVPLALVGALRQASDLGRLAADADAPITVAQSVRAALVWSLGWVTLPWPLTSTTSAWTPIPSWRWASAVFTAVGVLLLAVRAPRRVLPLLLLAGCFFGPGLAGTVRSGLVGERYLYVPLFCGAVAVVDALHGRSRRGGLLAGVGLALAGLVALGVRLGDWTSERALLEAAVRQAPDAYVHKRLANTLTLEGDARGAFASYRHAVNAGGPPIPRVCGPAVRLLADTGKSDVALRFAEEHAGRPSCAPDPDFLAAWAEAQIAAGRPSEAAVTLARWKGPAQPSLELPRVALCVLSQDARCVDEARARWNQGCVGASERPAASATDCAGDDLVRGAGELARRAGAPVGTGGSGG